MVLLSITEPFLPPPRQVCIMDKQFQKIWPVFDTKLQWELTFLFAKNRMIRTCALIGSLCYLSNTTPLVSLELYRKNPLQLRPFWEKPRPQEYCLYHTNSFRYHRTNIVWKCIGVPVICRWLTFECLNTFCTHDAKTQCKQNIIST